jgi:dTDP-glucose 4,6-dehydratase
MGDRVVLVTGGAGFIGANFVLTTRTSGFAKTVTLDKLTYAGNPANLSAVSGDSGHVFVQGDIADRTLVTQLLAQYRVTDIVNFAAESHVDRSIDAPDAFIRTNVVGTFELLEAARNYVATRTQAARDLRFLHISTDEVFGSLGASGAFTEASAYAPNSPYAASKAAADHLVRSYHRTYGLRTITTHSSNNYGPYQFPEKLVPLTILSALEERPLPIYGDGRHVRDWLFVEDHCDAIRLALTRGVAGETYAIGTRNERTNVELVGLVCSLLDELSPRPKGSYRELISHVKDRPGHDRRYAIDPSRAERELGFRATHGLEIGLRRTVAWYLSNRAWCTAIPSESDRTERLCLALPYPENTTQKAH